MLQVIVTVKSRIGLYILSLNVPHLMVVDLDNRKTEIQYIVIQIALTLNGMSYESKKNAHL